MEKLKNKTRNEVKNPNNEKRGKKDKREETVFDVADKRNQEAGKNAENKKQQKSPKNSLEVKRVGSIEDIAHKKEVKNHTSKK